MNKLIRPIFFSFVFLLAFSTQSQGQIYFGARVGGVDSNPFPNASIMPFIGYNGDFDSWYLKATFGYLQTILPAEEDKSRSVFSGGFISITPEFIFTRDRQNPFKGNIGFSSYFGNYYQQESTFLPGGTIGISWGFGGDRYTAWELVADMHLLAAKEKEGTSQGPLHTMAMFGILRKL